MMLFVIILIITGRTVRVLPPPYDLRPRMSAMAMTDHDDAAGAGCRDAPHASPKELRHNC
jgi:hypothetical protein